MSPHLPPSLVLNAFHCWGTELSWCQALCSPRGAGQGRREDNTGVGAERGFSGSATILGTVLISCRTRGKILLLLWTPVCTKGMARTPPHGLACSSGCRTGALERPRPGLPRRGQVPASGLQTLASRSVRPGFVPGILASGSTSQTSVSVHPTGSQPSLARLWGSKTSP